MNTTTKATKATTTAAEQYGLYYSKAAKLVNAVCRTIDAAAADKTIRQVWNEYKGDIITAKATAAALDG